MNNATARRSWFGVYLVIVAVAATLMAACGDDDADSSSSGSNGSSSDAGATSAASGERTAEAKAAAVKDAEAAGGKVDPPTDKLIGYMHLSASSEASVRMHTELKEAARLFDFKVIDCDPNFDPAKTAQCATTLLAQGPDLIISEAASTAALGGGIKAAHDKGIPWIVTGAQQTPSQYYTAQYVPDERKLTRVLNEWLFGEIRKRQGEESGVVGVFTAPTVGPGIVARDEQRSEDIGAHPDLSQKIHTIDLSDALQDTLSSTKQLVQQTPDMVALWQTCDFCAAPMVEALDQLGLTGDDRPITAAVYTTKQSRAQIAAGKMTGAVENNFGAMAWVALDQAVEFWARDKPFAKDNKVFSEGYGIEILEPWVVTKANLGDASVVRNQGEDYKTFFKTKWAEEFGVG